MNAFRGTTFAEKFCSQRKVHPADFEKMVLRLTLRRAARFLWPVLNLNPDYFGADRAFIRDVAAITRFEEFANAEDTFTYSPYNRGFLRRVLRLRVSRQRMRGLVKETLRN